jgi:tetratricopeptide (TPR) repeat protein
VWTAVGAGAAVAGVAFAAMQVRAGRKHPVLGPDDRLRVVLERPGGDNAGAGVGVLRAPTGRLPEYVRGRADLLTSLSALAGAPDGRVHVLAGLGGTGKSTIALRVAEQITQLGRPVWWVQAVDAGTVTAKLLGLASDLGAPLGEVTEAQSGRHDPADLLWRFLEGRAGWLLIFDNADDLSALTVGGNDVGGGAGWIRPSASGLIMVTSRESDQRAWGRNTEIHPVSWLDAATGGQVLADLAPAAGTSGEAAALSQRLGGLPLALHHAGSQLASEFAAEQTFTSYARALDERFGRLMGRGAADDRAIVTSTWELSMDALAARGRPQARPLLRVLSCLAPAVLIPSGMLDLTVLGQVCDDGTDGAADGLAALSSVGLISRSSGEAGTLLGVTVHPLVTETDRLHLDAEGPTQAGGIAVALLTAAAARLHSEQPGDWPGWVQFVPHLNALYGYLARRLTDASLAALAEVSVSVSAAFLWAGSYITSQDLAESAIRHAARLGGDHPAVVYLRFQVAAAYRFRGRYAEAEQEFRDILAIELRVFGAEHSSTLRTRYEIARMLAARGQYEEAEREFRDVLAVRQRIQGYDHPNTLTTRSEIARMLALRTQYEQAEREFREVLAVRHRDLGANHPDTLTSRSRVAQMLAARGQHHDAEKAYRDVLAARQQVLGADHPGTLATRHEIGRMLAARGQYEQAEQEFRDVLAARQQVLGADHPSTLATRHEIGRMLAARGQYEQAEQAYRDLLAVRERVLGPEHPSTRTTQDSLAELEKVIKPPSWKCED